MPKPRSRPALLDDIDRRQADVMERLDELDRRVEQILKAWTTTAPSDAASVISSEPTSSLERPAEPPRSKRAA